MITLEELVVKLEADNAKLISALNESAKLTARSSKEMEDAIAKFTDQATKKTDKFGDVMTVFAGTTLANLAVKGAELASQAFGAMKDAMVEGIMESAQFEQEMTRLANSLAMSGNFSAEASKGLETWIGEMETLSGIDDAVIAGNLAMLSSMTKLDAEGLKRAQQSALDLSAALGIDLNTATKMVGKAAEGNTDGFKKFGINIAESTDKSLTLANTLSTLESRFAGASGGAMKTFSGSLLGLQNSFGNLFQALGDVVVKNPAVIAAMNEITKIVSSLTATVGENAGSWRKDFAEALNGTIIVMAVVAKGTEELVRIMVAGFKTIYLGIQATVDAFQALDNVFKGDFEGAAAEFKETGDVFGSLSDTVEKGGNGISNTLMQIASASTEATRTMSASMEAVKPTIESTGQKLRELTWIEEQRKNASKEFAMGLAEDSQSIDSSYKMQQESLAMANEQGLISETTYRQAQIDAQDAYFAQQQQMLTEALTSQQITQQQYDLANTQLQMQQNAARAKMDADFNKQKIEGLKSTFGYISSLQSSSTKELAAIGKAAAITQATMDGITAVQGAYKWGTVTGGPALGAAFAAAAAAATAANVAKIAGVGLASGIDSVPGVGSRDNFPAVLAPGERVVPSETNQDLTAFLAKQSNQQAPMTVNVSFNGPVWGSGGMADVGAQVVEAINEAMARGMSLPLLGATR